MITLFVVPARKATLAGGIDSLKSISGLLKRLHMYGKRLKRIKRRLINIGINISSFFSKMREKTSHICAYA
jgi:hypothetical protein